MNKRDIAVIARHLAAIPTEAAYKAQSKNTLWWVYVETVADALAECSDEFDREAFLTACKVVPKRAGDSTIGPDGEVEGEFA